MPTLTYYMYRNPNINPFDGVTCYKGIDINSSTIPSDTGWNVGKTATNRYALLVQGDEVSRNQFSTTIEPDSTIDNTIAADNCIEIVDDINKTYDAGTWTFNFPVIAVSNGGTQDGRIRMRVFQRTSSTTFTELTSTTLLSTTVTNLTTTTDQNCQITWSAPSITISGDDTFRGTLFLKMAWQITGSANNNNSDVVLLIGQGLGFNVTPSITTPNYTRRRLNIN